MMIYVRLNGRLGNYLFQIATAASLAARHGSGFAAVCHENYLLPPPHNCTIYDYVQQFKADIFRNVDIIDQLELTDLYTETPGRYERIPFKEGICLVGSFQSEKYFEDQVVRDLFEISQSMRNRLMEKYGAVLERGVTSVHVRRGDYLLLPHEYNITSMQYFTDAIHRIGSKSEFLIISDDIAWCRENFKGANFSFAGGGSAIEDLYLQSLCKNNIISNSTFSWWGAWLNANREKIVIAPEPWYGQALSHIPTDDLVPETWVKLRNNMDLKYRFRSMKTLTARWARARYRSVLSR